MEKNKYRLLSVKEAKKLKPFYGSDYAIDLGAFISSKGRVKVLTDLYYDKAGIAYEIIPEGKLEPTHDLKKDSSLLLCYNYSSQDEIPKHAKKGKDGVLRFYDWDEEFPLILRSIENHESKGEIINRCQETGKCYPINSNFNKDKPFVPKWIPEYLEEDRRKIVFIDDIKKKPGDIGLYEVLPVIKSVIEKHKLIVWSVGLMSNIKVEDIERFFVDEYFNSDSKITIASDPKLQEILTLPEDPYELIKPMMKKR